MAKVNISIDDDLLKRADLFAEENYLTRSGLFSLSLSQYLNQSLASQAVKSLAFSMRRIADMGEIDDETKKGLDDFVNMANLLFGSSDSFK